MKIIKNSQKRTRKMVKSKGRKRPLLEPSVSNGLSTPKGMGSNVHNVQPGLATKKPAKSLTSIAYSPIEAAKAIGTTPGVLANWRCRKIGPKYYHQNRKIFYLHDDLVAWVTMFPVMTKDAYDIAVQ